MDFGLSIGLSEVGILRKCVGKPFLRMNELASNIYPRLRLHLHLIQTGPLCGTVWNRLPAKGRLECPFVPRLSSWLTKRDAKLSFIRGELI